jgi:hypothetical protein
MDLANPTAHAAQAYAIAGRFVPLAPRPTDAPPSASSLPDARFDLAALTSLPSAAPPAPTPTPPTPTAIPAPPPVAAQLRLPPPTLPPPPPAATTPAATTPAAAPPPPAALAIAIGPQAVATLSRATTLYSQTQLLTVRFGRVQPAALDPAAAETGALELPPPSTLTPVSQPPPAVASPPGSIGLGGVYSVGGVAAGPTHLLGFVRGSFLSVLV